MHVLIVPSWYPADAADLNGIFFREQAQALVRAGHRVGVIAPMFRSLRGDIGALIAGFGESDWIDGEIPVLRAHSVFTSTRVPHFDLWRWCQRGETLFARYLARHGRPDILHAHSLSLGGILAARLSARHGIPFGVTEHSTTYARGLVRGWQWPGLRAAAQAAGFRLAVSQALADLVQDRLQGPEWSVLPNLLDPLFETPTPPRPPEAGPLRLVSIAQLREKKGFDLLLAALARARARAPHVDLRLTIGGDGPERAALEAQARELGIGNAVTFLGALPRADVLEALRAADAFVLASRHETFGIVFIEALAQGLPVLATRSGGPEGIVTGADGILVPRDDIDALAEGMLALAARIDTYDRAGLRARAIGRFGEAGVISRLEAVYARALGQRG